MPRTNPAELDSLSLEAAAVTRGVPLHDVWCVDLAGPRAWTVPELRDLVASAERRSLPKAVRALFAIRAFAGRVLALDASHAAAADPPRSVPPELAGRSRVPPGTPAGPFRTLFVLDSEAAFAARNATVDAVLVVALAARGESQRLYWATHVAPVGVVTRCYMALIDPFRQLVVYPGLERWLVDLVARAAER